TLPELRLFGEEHPSTWPPPNTPMALRDYARLIKENRDTPEPLEEQINAWLQSRIQKLQQADRIYWRPIIAQLRQLSQAGELMIEGTEV
ncbi:MAG: hypothetical protein M1608_08650, partial [Candidatus Omnitrophica bacterium]|nr:hypothetical protein [Candidatus Omnitrophota bacterium]